MTETIANSLLPGHLDYIKKSDSPSAFFIEDNYSLISIRLVDINDDGINYLTKGYLKFINTIFYFDAEKNDFVKLEGGFKGVYNEIYPYYEKLNRLIEYYTDQIDELEDGLFDREFPAHFMDIWFNLKKDLSRIFRYYKRNHVVIGKILKVHEGNEFFPDFYFKKLKEELIHNISNVDSNLNRLDNLHHYHSSIKNDRLNKDIYFLTFLSAIFLPLNLAVGFFGMNTEGMFFKDNPDGTYKVVFIMSISLILSLIGVKLVKVIDRLILKRLLGNFTFYRNISSKLDSLLKMN
jgi:magnesium transporter